MSDNTPYTANDKRYDRSASWFRRCGDSGLKLPAISLGCWHNFGGTGTDAGHHADEAAFHENCWQMLFTAFDHGITHFDLANNYGPPAGAAEERVGRILKEDFARYRDELIISTKAGYWMWPGPYGEWGSRKYLMASLDQSLKRLRLDYVDIFYSHRPDPETPLEETLGALDSAVRQGKALYTGISSYNASMTAQAVEICRAHGWFVPIIHQPNYSMLNRGIEQGVQEACARTGLGVIAFCPLAQGLLTGKYLKEIPADSRAKQTGAFLNESRVTPDVREKARKLNEIAQQRGQSLAQLALAWVLRERDAGQTVTSALIGASRPGQIEENAKSLEAGPITPEQLKAIDDILK